MSFTRTESERLARLKGCTTGIYCRYGRPTGGGITGPTGPAGYSFFTLGGNQGALTAGTGSIIVVNMAGPTGTVSYSNILQASQAGYTGSAPAPSPYLKVGSDIIPDRNNVYNIGSRDLQFRSAYFGANTVYIDGVPIGSTGGTTIVMPKSVQIGQTVLTASGDTLVLPSTVRLGSINGPILGATGPAGMGPDGGMQWINTNLLGPAPKIDVTDIKVRSSEIFVGWTYPTQQHLTFVDIWVPAINGFSAKLDYGIVGGSQQTQTLLNNQSTQEYIDYRRAATKKSITGIILTNVNTNTGYFENWVWHDGTSRAVYRYYHPDFATLDPAVQPVIKLWYSNFSTTTNEGAATLNVFILAGPPGPPRNLVGTANSSTQATLNFNHPLWVDIDDYNSTATIKSYTIVYDTSGASRRYPAPLPQTTSSQLMSITNYNHEDSLSQMIANLYPDSTYRFEVVAKNSANVDGSGSAVEVSLGPLNAPPKLSGVGLDPAQFYSGTIKRVSDGLELSATSGLLLNVPADGRIQTTMFTSPIQHMDYRGSSATGLMRLTGSVKNSAGSVLSSATQIYNGFSDPIIIPGDVVSGGSIVRTVGITDAQVAAEKQGFYLKATNQVFMDMSGYIVPSSDPYTMEIRHEHLDGAGATVGGAGVAQLKMFYDMPSVKPTITLESWGILTGTFKTISGIYVMGPSANLRASILLTGYNSYFYRTPFLEYTNTTGSINTSETSLINIDGGTAGQLNNNIRIIRDNIGTKTPLVVSNSNTTFQKSLDMQLKAHTIGHMTSSDISSKPIIIDVPSYNLLENTTKYPTVIQSLGNTYVGVNKKIGFRVLSGASRKILGETTNPFVTQFDASLNGIYIHDIPYDNNATLIGTEELQIVNGKYRTKGSSMNGYIDYSLMYANNKDYSTIDTSGYRFATFKWNLDELQNKLQNYNYLEFTISGIKDVYLDKIQNNAYIHNKKILLYYRFIDNTNTVYPTTYASLTTSWIDANNRLPELTSGNYITPNDNSYSLGGLLEYPVLSGDKLTFIVRLHTIFNRFVRLYCRIGLPMDIDSEFEFVEAAVNIVE